MRFLSLRWVFLLAAVAAAARCALSGLTLERAAFVLACGGLWLWLSRRKVRSLDRDALGVPPRA